MYCHFTFIMIIAFTGSMYIWYQDKNFDGFTAFDDVLYLYNVHGFLFMVKLSPLPLKI